MKNKTIKFFCIVTVFLFLFSIIPQNVMAYSLKDTFIYDTNKGLNADIEYHTGNLFVMGYTGILNSGQLKVVDIDSSGNIGSNISLFTFKDRAFGIDVLKVYENIFVVSYLNVTFKGYLATYTCSDSGIFDPSYEDIELISSSTITNNSLNIIKVKENIYLITYMVGYALYGKTINIDSYGHITTTYQTRVLYTLPTSYIGKYSFCFLDDKISYHAYAYVIGYREGTISKFVCETIKINNTGTFDNISSVIVNSIYIGYPSSKVYDVDITFIKILSNNYYSFIVSIADFVPSVMKIYAYSFRCSDLFILDSTYLNYREIINTPQTILLANYSLSTIQTDVDRITFFHSGSATYVCGKYCDIDVNGLLSTVTNIPSISGSIWFIYNVERVSSNGVYCVIGYNNVNWRLITYDGFSVYGEVGEGEIELPPTEENYVSPIDYLPFGDITMQNRGHTTLPMGNPYVETEHFVCMNGELKEFDLLIPNSYYDMYAQLNNPVLVLNGILFENPDFYYNYDISGSNTLVVFRNIDMTLDEYVQTTLNIEILFWGESVFCTGGNGNEITGDGVLGYWYHAYPLWFGNNWMDGLFISNYDISYRGWYIPYYNQTYTDSLMISITSMRTNRTLMITYSANMSLGTTYVIIKKIGSSSEYMNHTAIPFGTAGDFLPLFYIANDGSGSFYCILKRDGVVLFNRTFTVIQQSGLFNLFTDKLLYSTYEKPIVTYSYNSSYTGHTGQIQVLKGSALIRNIYTNTTDWELNNIILEGLDNGLYNLKLGTLEGGLFNPITDMYCSFSISGTGFYDSIGLVQTAYSSSGISHLTVFNDESVDVDFHNGQIGIPTYIFIDSKNIFDITDIEEGRKTIGIIEKTGTYTISMNRNNLDVAICYLVVKNRPSESEGYSLSPPFTYLAGTILTLFCLFIPSLLMAKSNLQSEILKYVPLFSGVFGFILSCIIGFFPWYAIFGLILVLVIVLAVIYQSKKG